MYDTVILSSKALVTFVPVSELRTPTILSSRSLPSNHLYPFAFTAFSIDSLLYFAAALGFAGAAAAGLAAGLAAAGTAGALRPNLTNVDSPTIPSAVSPCFF